MKSELFIYKYDNIFNGLENSNFKDGIEGYVTIDYQGAIPKSWEVLTGNEEGQVDYSIFYPADSSVQTSLYQENVLSASGKVRITATVTSPKDGSALAGGVTFGFNTGSPLTATTVGIHTFISDVTVTDSASKRFYISSTTTFNGGFTDIKIEVLSGEWIQLDTFNDVQIPLTFNISDVEDIASKRGSYSKTITLPGSKRNNNAFEYLFDINSLNGFEFNDSMPCYILYDTKQVFSGNFMLTNVSKVRDSYEYEANVYSSSVDLFSRLGDKKLAGNTRGLDDLDFSEYNHILTKEYIEDSWSNTNGSGIVYVPINKSGRESSWYDDANVFAPDEMTPAVYAKEIFDKILSSAGFTYDSDFLNTDYFKKLICPYPNYALRVSEADAERSYNNNELASSTSSFILNPSTDTKTVISDPSGETTNTTLGWSSIEEGSYTPWSDITKKYTVQENGIFNIDIDWQVEANIYGFYHSTGLPPVGDWDLYTAKTQVSVKSQIYIERGGVEIPVSYNTGYENFSSGTLPDILYMSGSAGSTSPVISGQWKYSNDIFLEAGDTIYHKITIYLPFTYNSTLWDGSSGTWFWRYGSSCGNLMRILLNLKDTTDSTFSVTKSSRVTEGNVIPANSILHQDTKQADLVSSIFKMFNLYVDDSSNTKVLKIEPRDDFYSNSTSDTLDWSDKVDHSQQILIEKASDLDEKVTWMHYKDSGTAIEEAYKDTQGGSLYGEYYKENSNNVDSSEKEEIALIFAPAPLDRVYPTALVMPSVYKMSSGNVIDKNVSHSPLIMFWNGLKNTYNVSNEFIIKSRIDDSEIVLDGEFPFAGHFDEPYDQYDDAEDLMFDTNPNRYYIQSTMNTGWSTPNNLYNKFYNNQIKELLSGAKLTTMYIHLNEADIESFDFSKRIFIDDTYYRVIEISEWVPEQTSKVKLLQVLIDTFTYETVTPLYDFDIREPIRTKVPIIDGSTPADIVVSANNDLVYAQKSTSESIRLSKYSELQAEVNTLNTRIDGINSEFTEITDGHLEYNGNTIAYLSDIIESNWKSGNIYIDGVDIYNTIISKNVDYVRVENLLLGASSSDVITQLDKTTLTANDDRIASSDAIKTYVDNSVSGTATYSSVSVSLPSSGWSLSSGYYTQTVTVTGVTTSNDLIVRPYNTRLSYDGWTDNRVMALSQTTNSVTFQAQKLPTTNMTAVVVILEEI